MAQDQFTGGADDRSPGGTSSRAGPPPGSPLDALFASLRETLGDLAPEALLNRMQPVVARFLEQFELVPRKDFDGHLAALQRLEDTVTALEARIAELERQD